jgi:hypothetical protein
VRAVRACAAFAALGACFAAAPAQAATLVADYRFDDSYASSVPGAPPIEPVGTGDSFAAESVRGHGPNRVLRFPMGNGLHLATAGLGVPDDLKQEYAVVVDFRFAAVSSYRRILNWHPPSGPTATDDGLYVHDGKLDVFYSQSSPSSATPFTPNRYAQVVLERYYDENESMVITGVFVNGAFAGTSTVDAWSRLTADGLWFFTDDEDEESAGAVARIRFYTGTLTQSDLDAIAQSDPPPPDRDSDGAFDYADNCRAKPNPAQTDSDRDGRGDACDTDDDNDGLADTAKVEKGDARIDRDFDDDGLGDRREVRGTHTNPRRFDSDHDGVSDGVELGNTGAVADPRGAVRGTDLKKLRRDRDPKTKSNPHKRDTDADGLSDGAEDENHNGRRDSGETSPLDPDTDGDGVIDSADHKPLDKHHH